MNIRTNAVLLSCCALFSSQMLSAQNLHIEPGVERWWVKTTVLANQEEQTVTLNELLSLPNPIDRASSKYDSTRIPVAVGPRRLKEGDLVRTEGWLHLVALEDDWKNHRDGDYHVQIRNSAEWADSCLVVEVPFPEFVADSTLAEQCGAVRQFIKDKLLKGKEPGTKGNKLRHAVFVTITGQLFFDLPHVKGNPRGKRGMKSYTPWEIHPVMSIKFTPVQK